MLSKKILRSATPVFGILVAVSVFIGFSTGIAVAQCDNDFRFTTEFFLESCGGFSNTGINPFFILTVGYQLVLEGQEDEDVIRSEITVLNETEPLDIDVTACQVPPARVVEDREYVNGTMIEKSRNFFLICNRTNGVFYGGEDVDICDIEERGGFDDAGVNCADGEEPDHDGAWRAGVNDAKMGLMMPGTFLLRSKYFQEQAWNDGVADRAQHTAMGLTAPDPLGDESAEFTGCVEVIDTNPVEGICRKRHGDVKIYCPGVGLVQDEELELVCYGTDCI